MVRNESGFTLIELLVVIAIIAVLVGLSMTNFSLYKSSASYSVSQNLVRDMFNAAEAGLIDESNPPAAVGLVSQNSPGPMSNPQAAALMSALVVPRNAKVTVEYDPNCFNAGCQQLFLEASHCSALEHIQVIRYGDGFVARLENISGGGCS